MKLRSLFLAGLVLALPLISVNAADKPAKPGKWIKMFNGKNLEGWKANERPESWKVVKEDGKPALKVEGGPSHLFWMKYECEDCEFQADFKVLDGANSGMYFRTAFGPGFPKGYEAQVNSTHRDPVKTGSLYNFHKNFDSPTKPGEWGTQNIKVQGKHIIISVNGKVITDFVDEKNTFSKGYICLQGHDPKSITFYRNLMFKNLTPAQK